MILNSNTFQAMLQPPFVETALAGSFITFDPIMYGDASIINAGRLRSMLEKHKKSRVYVWSEKESDFRPVDFANDKQQVENPLSWRPQSLGPVKTADGGRTFIFEKPIKGDGMVLSGCEINPLDTDFLEFEMMTGGTAKDPAKAYWNIDEEIERGISLQSPNLAKSSPGHDHGGRETVRIRLSEKWRWFKDGRITSLFIELPQADNVSISDLRFLKASHLCPGIGIENGKADNTGVYFQQEGHPLRLKVTRPGRDGDKDSPETKTIGRVRIDISKPNFFFENFRGALRKNAVGRQIFIQQDDATASIDMAPEVFSKKGYFEIQAQMVDARRRPVGELSDPLTLRVF